MTKRKILVCDDDPDILDMLEIILTPHFDITCEIDSRLVLDRAKALQADVVIVDLWMPFVSGTDLIRKIREDANISNVTIVAISASPSGEKEAKAAGADLFVAKPFQVNALVTAVKNAHHKS